MSYNYSKSESKRVYADPEGTVSRYQVICTNNEEYSYKNNGFLILYLTNDKFIIRSPYDPAVFSVKGYGQVYLEIPFSSITKITCCGEEFSQIINLYDFPQSSARKNDISIEFRTGSDTVRTLEVSINCYISLSKNVKECQELIDLFNKTVYNSNNCDLKLQKRPLFTDKLYLHSPTLAINGRFLFKAYNDSIVFKSEFDNQEEIFIPVANIISFTHEKDFVGEGTALSQISYLKLVYKDGFNKQITIFIKFYLLHLNNSFPKRYIEFLTRLTEMGLIN